MQDDQQPLDMIGTPWFFVANDYHRFERQSLDRRQEDLTSFRRWSRLVYLTSLAKAVHGANRRSIICGVGVVLLLYNILYLHQFTRKGATVGAKTISAYAGNQGTVGPILVNMLDFWVMEALNLDRW